MEELGEWHHMYVRLKIPEKRGFLNGETLLDAGCGNGRYLSCFRFNKKIRFCAGLDISRARVYSANKRFKERGSDVALIVADIEEAPFRNDVFDVVFSTDVIEHLPHPLKGIRELVRISKDKVIICTPNKLCPLDMSRFAHIFGSHTPPPIEKYVTRFQLVDMLKFSGIRDMNIAVSETSFVPLGWILVNRKLSLPMKLVKFSMFVEKYLEKIPLVKYTAGVLVATAKV